MKKHRFSTVSPTVVMMIAALVVFTLLSGLADLRLMAFEAAVTVLVSGVAIGRARRGQNELFHRLEAVSDLLSAADRDSLKTFSIPMAVTADSGEILWYNDRFREDLLDGQDNVYGENIARLFGDGKSRPPLQKTMQITYRNRSFRVFAMAGGYRDQTIYYFVEDTELKRLADEYLLSRSCVMLLTIDNYEELMQNAKESEKSNLLGKIDSILEAFIAETHGFMLKLKSDRFIAVIEDRDLTRIIDNKFQLLEQARGILANGTVPVTLSIGVGRGAGDLAESDRLARQGIDMARGRGGDQAVVRSQDAYEFYGGVSKGRETTTKVKSRMVATALKELIEQSENVLVMGHSYSDLDAIGAATAVACGVRALGKHAVVAVDTEKTMAGVLIDYNAAALSGLYVHPDVAIHTVTRDTLLIIVDTHTTALLESEPLYRACERVVVIDHHRKKVDFIDNAVLFYHEPYASSASEMVTEILQYWSDKPVIGKIQAEGLLAGIMLDTKNFVIKTGVRTFEAAAYLRRRGAETSEARKLFSSSMDTYQRKSRLVSSAIIYKGCAIAQSEGKIEDIRLVAPQAADDLLNISDVRASFVLYEADGAIHISARSLGEINVQLILEKLGGGGHMSMAGAQLAGVDMVAANAQLLSAIDSYMGG